MGVEIEAALHRLHEVQVFAEDRQNPGLDLVFLEAQEQSFRGGPAAPAVLSGNEQAASKARIAKAPVVPRVAEDLFAAIIGGSRASVSSAVSRTSCSNCRRKTGH